MDQFVPADWSSNVGEAFATSCCQDDGLVELLRCGGHVVMQSQPPERVAASAMVQDHEAAPWFQYPAVFGEDRSLEEDLFSEIFGDMPAGSDPGSDSALTPLRAGEARDAVSSHDYASATVAASSIRPKMPGKRKQSDTSESPGEVMRGVEEPVGPAHKPQTGKRRRVAQEHNLSERRRRDRINEKMRALQQLVPHCNKTDKASMLDEAIEYLKSLQLQVQTMWTTGGGMAPASGAHRYMQRIASTTRSRMPPFRTCVYTSSNGTKY